MLFDVMGYHVRSWLIILRGTSRSDSVDRMNYALGDSCSRVSDGLPCFRQSAMDSCRRYDRKIVFPDYRTHGAAKLPPRNLHAIGEGISFVAGSMSTVVAGQVVRVARVASSNGVRDIQARFDGMQAPWICECWQLNFLR